MGGLFRSKDLEPQPLAGVPALMAAYLAFNKGDSQAMQALLTHHEARYRYFYAFEVGEIVERSLVDAWVARAPQSAPARFLRAAQGLTWAWEARSARAAAQVGQNQMHEFFRRLQTTQADLEQVIEADAQDPNPLALMLILAKGQNRSLAECQEVFSWAQQVDPHHYDAHRNYLDCLLKKWGGTHEGALDFAVKAMQGAPEGSELGCLVFAALSEQWLYLDAFDKQPQQATQFRTRPDIVALTREAYSRSLGNKRYLDWPGSLNPRNLAAFWLYLSGQKDLLRIELQKIGPRLTRGPWEYLGAPGKIFSQARALAGV